MTGMTYKQFRHLACGCGGRLQSKFPSSCLDNNIAGSVRFVGFVKRHKNKASPARKYKSVEHHNVKTNVREFFDNYECAFISWNFIAGRFYNNDETGVSREYSLPTLLPEFS